MATKAQESRTRTTRGSSSARTPARRTSAQHRAMGGTTAAMVGVAAAGLATGLLASFGRKVAAQAPTTLKGDWMEGLKAEHRTALALFDALQATDSSHTQRRRMLLMQLKHALAKHALAEENVIYPALREWGDKADADKLNHDHGYVKQYLYALENMAKDAPDFPMQVAEFRETLEAHIREEEEDIFPQLHQALSEEKNKALTTAANREGFKLA